MLRSTVMFILAHAAVALFTLTPVHGSDWNWTGNAAGDEWHDYTLIPDSNPPEYVNNWGITSTVLPLGTPDGDDDAYLGMAGPYLGLSTSVANVYVSGELDIYANLGISGELVASGVVGLGANAYLSGCTVQTSGSGSISSLNSFNDISANPTFHNVTINGTILVPSNKLLQLDGTITNAGSIELEDGYLNIGSPTTLTGSGTLVLSDSLTNFLCATDPAGPVRLTNQNNLISGAGVFGAPSAGATTMEHMAITNNHLIVANQSSSLQLLPAPSPLDSGYSVVNNGTMRATSGAVMELYNGTYDNTNGIVEAEDASAVELYYGTILFGGTLQTVGSGAIRSVHASGGPVSPIIMDLTSTGSLVIPTGQELQMQGTVTNQGTISLEGPYTLLYIGSTAATLAGDGVVAMSNESTNSIQGPSAGYRLTNQGNTIRGSGNLGVNALAITNNGLVVADQSTELQIAPVTTALDGQTPLINNGTLRAASGATLRLWGDGAYLNTNGIIEALDGSAVVLDQGTWIFGGTLQTSGSGVIRIRTQTWRRSGIVDITNQGLLEVPWDRELHIQGTITNNGIFDNSFYLIPTDAVVLAGSGVLYMRGDSQIQDAAAYSLTNQAGHTIHATGSGNGRIFNAFSNSGALLVDAGETLFLHSTYSPQAGSTTQVDGTLTLLAGPTTMSGTLRGSGTFGGPLTIDSTGRLCPGASAGTLTTASLTISSGATYDWEYASGVSDLVDVIGNLDFGSAILSVNLAVLSGPPPDQMVLFEYDSLSSVPDTSQIVLPDGYSYTGIDTSGNRITLTGVSFGPNIFADDFESGDTSGWSSTAGLVLKAMRCRFDEGTDWLDLRFAFDQAQLKAKVSDPAKIVVGHSQEDSPLFRIEARATRSWLELRASIAAGNGSWLRSPWTPFPADGSEGELAWDGLTGALYLYVDQALLLSVVDLEQSLPKVSSVVLRGVEVESTLPPARITESGR